MQRINKIINSDDFELFLDAKSYQRKIRAKCDKMYTSVEAECRERKASLEQQLNQKMEAELFEYKQAMNSKVETYIEKLNQLVLDRVAEVIGNLVDNHFDAHYIKQIVKTEVEHSFSDDKILVYANHTTLKELQPLLEASLESKMAFFNDNKLADNVCVCENQFYKIKINVNEARDKILAMLKEFRPANNL